MATRRTPNGNRITAKEVYELLDRKTAEMSGAIEAVRARHHESMQSFSTNIAQQTIQLKVIEKQLDEGQKSFSDVRADMDHLSDKMGQIEERTLTRIEQEAVRITLVERRWDRLIGIVIGATIAGGGIGGGIAALIQALGGKP